MMSLKSKRELLEVVQARYLKAKKVEKQKMLDEFTAATGYHRKYAIWLLKNKVQVQNHYKGKTKTYKTIYGSEVVQALEQIWEIYGHICSKRLQPYSPAPTAGTVCQKPFACWSVAKKSNSPTRPKNCS
jgi:hypothetical protein